MINIIVAIAQNGVIGSDNQLLWHISEDLQHFKQITTGHPVVMGRKTFESLGRPLPGRENVVITRSDVIFEGCRMAHSIDEALAPYSPIDQVFIIGGAEIYRALMPIADRFYLTRVLHDYEGDTQYPRWDANEWAMVSQEGFECGAKYSYPFVFEEYRRQSVPESENYIGQTKRSDAALINKVAERCFEPTYRNIISQAQIKWMFEDFYSTAHIESKFDQGMAYYMLYHNAAAVGYVAIERQAERLVYLDKLYLDPTLQGKGLGALLIRHAFDKARKWCGGACRLELEVNRNNHKAITFYQRMGMHQSEVIDTILEGAVPDGSHFERNDYRYAIDL